MASVSYCVFVSLYRPFRISHETETLTPKRSSHSYSRESTWRGKVKHIKKKFKKEIDAFPATMLSYTYRTHSYRWVDPGGVHRGCQRSPRHHGHAEELDGLDASVAHHCSGYQVVSGEAARKAKQKLWGGEKKKDLSTPRRLVCDGTLPQASRWTENFTPDISFWQIYNCELPQKISESYGEFSHSHFKVYRKINVWIDFTELRQWFSASILTEIQKKKKI